MVKAHRAEFAESVKAGARVFWFLGIFFLGLVFCGKTAFSTWNEDDVGVFGARARDDEKTTRKIESFHGMLGPLAAIPGPLDDQQLRQIRTSLNVAFLNNDKVDKSSAHPVLFVPGLFSSQLETKLTHRKKAHWWLPDFICPRTTDDYQHTWLFKQTWWNVLPYVIDCYVEELLTRWDSRDNTTENALPWRTGIDTRTTKSFEGVMKLDANTPTYQYYADWLTQYLGYLPDEQMIAQPFDWRLGPESWRKAGREFDQMKSAIEKVVEKNDGRGIVALSISAGGPFFALFLNRHVDQAWKDRYIHAWVSVSAALSGSGIAPMQYISLQHNSYFNDETPAYIRKALGRIVSSTSSVSWLFPHEDSFRNAVITTPTRSYKAHELDEALTDAGYAEEQVRLYLSNRPYFGGTNLVPGVRTYCLSGYGIDTISRLSYNTSDLSDAPVAEVDDGDNCVTVEALRQCDAWAEHQDAPIYGHHYFNASHAGLLYDARVVKHFFDVVVGKEDEVSFSGGKKLAFVSEAY